MTAKHSPRLGARTTPSLRSCKPSCGIRASPTRGNIPSGSPRAEERRAAADNRRTTAGYGHVRYFAGARTRPDDKVHGRNETGQDRKSVNRALIKPSRPNEKRAMTTLICETVKPMTYEVLGPVDDPITGANPRCLSPTPVRHGVQPRQLCSRYARVAPPGFSEALHKAVPLCHARVRQTDHDARRDADAHPNSGRLQAQAIAARRAARHRTAPPRRHLALMAPSPLRRNACTD
ncbi:hypothetical protein PSP20601_04965 [Pandoraea sputorum]|nr:hypothetical protein PSP20601_04965 [Pandoraea sputorum]